MFSETNTLNLIKHIIIVVMASNVGSQQFVSWSRTSLVNSLTFIMFSIHVSR